MCCVTGWKQSQKLGQARWLEEGLVIASIKMVIVEFSTRRVVLDRYVVCETYYSIDLM